VAVARSVFFACGLRPRSLIYGIYKNAYVVQWSEFLATDPEVPSTILGGYQIFREVVGVERGALSLVTTTEELLERKSSGPGLEIREYGRGDQLL
jgi:hypothetical protein